jgi:type I restriction enzyme S subunit
MSTIKILFSLIKNFNKNTFENIEWNDYMDLDYVSKFNFKVEYSIKDAKILVAKVLTNILLDKLEYNHDRNIKDIIKSLELILKIYKYYLENKENKSYKKTNYINDIKNLLPNIKMTKSISLSKFHENMLIELENNIIKKEEPKEYLYYGEEINFGFKPKNFETKRIIKLVKQMHDIIYSNEALQPTSAMNDILMIMLLKYIEDHLDKFNIELDKELQENINMIKLSKFDLDCRQKDEKNGFDSVEKCGDILMRHNLIGKIITRHNFLNCKKGKTIIDLKKKLYEFFPENEIINVKSSMGLACEIYGYFIKEYSGTKNKLGQYFTPVKLVHLIISYLQHKYNIKENFKDLIISDPFMGTAKMLSMLSDVVKTNINNIIGIDIESDTYRYAFLNMFNEYNGIPKYLMNDNSLINFNQPKANLIITNPPFGLKQKHKDFESMLNIYPNIDGKKINNGTLLCLMSVIYRLTDNDGLCGIILPDGKEMSSKQFIYFRKWMTSQINLETIIKIPSGVFEHTSINTCVLIFNKMSKTKEIEFLETNLECNKLKQVFKNKININQLKLHNYSFDFRDYKKYENEKFNYICDYKKLGDICSIQYGERIIKNNINKNNDNIYPVYGGGDITFYYDNFNRSGLTCKISRFGISEHNCVQMLNKKYFLHDNGFTLISKNTNKILNEFLFHYLINNKNIIFLCKRGSGQGYLDIDKFNNINIPIPPLKYQKKLVEQLDVLENQKEIFKQCINNTKKEMKIYLDLQLEINEKQECKLSDVVEIIIGGTPSRENKTYWENGNNLWVSIKDISNSNGYIYDTKEKITDYAIKNSNVKLIDNNTILYSFKLTIGKIAIAKTDLYTNEAIAGFNIKNKNLIINKYLYYYLQFNKLSNNTSGMYGGGSLNKEKISECKIFICDINIQKKIVEYLDNRENEITNYKNRINELDNLMKDILSNL